MTPHRRLVVVLLLTLTPAAAAGASTVPPGFTDSLVAGPDPDTGVTVPVALAFHPGTGEPWVAEKGQGTSPSSARIRRVDPAAGTAATVMTLECVDSRGERGVLNLAFDPHDPDAAYLYLFYTRRFESSGACFVSGRPASSRNIVSRIPLNGAAGPAPELMEIVLEGPSLSSQSEIHNGGGLAFLPDGTLLASMGDAGLDPFNQPVSRDPGDLRGKVLRIRPNGTIPGDNPLIGKAGARPEIYAMGFRNPFRLSVDPQDGIALAADVGESSWEEIDLLLPGADYGWPCREASATFVNCMPAPPQGSLVDPVFAYSHSSVSPPVSGRSVTGGPFYRATAFPAEYHGSYFFADYVRGWIRRARVGPGGAFDQVEQFASGVEGPVDLKVGPDGCLYYAAIIGSEVRRTCYAGGDNGQPAALATAAPAGGPAPLEVFFHGGDSSDPDGDPLNFTWHFGDGSASVRKRPSHSYSTPGVYSATLIVDDGSGEPNSADASAPLRIVAGNDPPDAAILAPAAGVRYQAGQAVTFEGWGADLQDGTLGPSAFAWTVVFHHGGHTHPFLGPITGMSSGSFTIPAGGEDDTDVFYEIRMEARDSGAPVGVHASLSAVRSIRLDPVVSRITLATDPPAAGLVVDFDGIRLPAPAGFPSVAGFPRTIGVATPQSLAGRPFVFERWSDGGAASHSIVAPAIDTTYTARFICPTLSVPLGLRVDGPTAGLLTLSWFGSIDLCHQDSPGQPQYAIYRSPTAVPAAPPGVFPMDPPFELIGYSESNSFSFAPGPGTEFYLVLDIGRDSQPGPAGHYGPWP